jgi:hypothetical protein
MMQQHDRQEHAPGEKCGRDQVAPQELMLAQRRKLHHQP